MKVKALGTSFEVYSYDEGQTVETILLDGSVQVAVANSFTHKVNYKIMVPNQRLTFDRSAGAINVEKLMLTNIHYGAITKRPVLRTRNWRLLFLV